MIFVHAEHNYIINSLPPDPVSPLLAKEANILSKLKKIERSGNSIPQVGSPNGSAVLYIATYKQTQHV